MSDQKQEQGAKKPDTISEESAKAQFQRFMDYYELSKSNVLDSALEGFDASCKRIINALQIGRLEILSSPEGVTAKQILRDAPGNINTITYGVLTGKHKVEMKACSDKDNYGKMYALLGSLSGLGSDSIMGLKGTDLSLAECLGMLFLQV